MPAPVSYNDNADEMWDQTFHNLPPTFHNSRDITKSAARELDEAGSELTSMNVWLPRSHPENCIDWDGNRHKCPMLLKK